MNFDHFQKLLTIRLGNQLRILSAVSTPDNMVQQGCYNILSVIQLIDNRRVAYNYAIEALLSDQDPHSLD